MQQAKVKMKHDRHLNGVYQLQILEVSDSYEGLKRAKARNKGESNVKFIGKTIGDEND